MPGNVINALAVAISRKIDANNGYRPDYFDMQERFVPDLVEDLFNLTCHGPVKKALGGPEVRKLLETLVRTGECQVHAVRIRVVT